MLNIGTLILLYFIINAYDISNYYSATYYHEGHTDEQLAKAMDSFYSKRTPIIVLSLETHSKQFVQLVTFVLVWDFLTSIAHY